MKITILGNNSALPAYGRYPTSQVIEINEKLFLMDCGEGAQMRMQQFGIKSARINHIFISHMHGDHYLGLVGFLSSMSLLGRTKELYLFAPKEIKHIIDIQLPWNLGYQINYRFIEENESAVLVDEEKIQISCFPVYHSVPTHGFVFEEKRRKRILVPANLVKYEIPKYFYKRLAEGEDYIFANGTLIQNTQVTIDGHPNKVYVFAADTKFAPEICTYFQGANVLYHESTYLEDNILKAFERFHTTSKQAAEIAKMAGVGKLLLGHFSSKYKHLQPFLDEAQPIFSNTELALEGMVFEIE